MDKFVIKGGNRLEGKVRVSGAKNATLPIMAASLLSEEEVHLDGLPDVTDVSTMASLLEELGVKVSRQGNSMKLKVVSQENSHARYDLVRKMRASVCVLGPLLAKRGFARVAMPGGCAIGPRPVSYTHLTLPTKA